MTHAHAFGESGFKLMTKTVLITGAARGIGLATAEIFAENHYNIVLLDRDAPALEAAGDRLPDALRLPIDIANPQAGGEVAAAIKGHFGRLDCLVNNAGVADFGPIEACDVTTWRRVMDTNLDGMFYLSQALTPLLRETAAAWSISPRFPACVPRPCGSPMAPRRRRSCT